MIRYRKKYTHALVCGCKTRYVDRASKKEEAHHALERVAGRALSVSRRALTGHRRSPSHHAMPGPLIFDTHLDVKNCFLTASANGVKSHWLCNLSAN